MSREPKAIGQFLPGILREIKGPTLIQKRLIDGAALPIENPNAPQNILFQHTVLCQTCLPFRNPGDQIRTWERVNGTVHLLLEAGYAMHPTVGRFVPLGLPFGPKARMILMHINQQALKQKTPDIEVEDSLTRFVKRTLNLDGNGPPPNLDELMRIRLSGGVAFDAILPGPSNDEDPADVFVDLAAQSDIWRTALAAATATLLEQWVSDFNPGNAERSAALGELCYLAARIGSITSMDPLAQLVSNRNAANLVGPGEDLRLRALRALVGLLGSAPYEDASQYHGLLEETLAEPRLALVSATGLIGMWPEERESVLTSLPDQVERGDLLDVAIDIAFRRRG